LNGVGIVAALAAEVRHFGPATPLDPTTHLEPAAHFGRSTQRRGPLASLADGTLLVVSGIGCAAAALGARALIEAGATSLASWGVAGGLDPALTSGTIFLPSEVISLDGTALPTTRDWRERVGATIGVHRPVAGGKLLTSPQAIGSVADKAMAFSKSGAAAVDMESLAVAEVARSHGMPFIAVRVIVDSAADVLPRALMSASVGGHLQIWRLIGALALSPGDLAPLIRLARGYRAASRSFATIARAGLPGPHAVPIASDTPQT
jgi:adenosylhomocysteine nucleosidase